VNQDSVYRTCPTRTLSVLLSNSTLPETDTIPRGDAWILLTTARRPTRSLAPTVALLLMRKLPAPALSAGTYRQTALPHIAITETVARQTRNFADQPDTAHLHRATAIHPPGTARFHHALAMHRQDHPSLLRIRLVDKGEDTLHNLTLQIPIL
jgi:hypothetical protein